MARKKPPLDPRIARALDKRESAERRLERATVRLLRAARAVDKERRTVARLERYIDRIAHAIEAEEVRARAAPPKGPAEAPAE